MSEPLVITISGTPSKLLAPNRARATHYMAKHVVSKPLRETGRWAAFPFVANNVPLFVGPVVVRETIAWGKGERRTDLDAIAVMCKPVLDGFTDAGVWLDDSQIVELTVRQERDPDGVGFIRVEVWDSV